MTTGGAPEGIRVVEPEADDPGSPAAAPFSVPSRLRGRWIGPTVAALAIAGVLYILVRIANAFLRSGSAHVTKTLALASLGAVLLAVALVPLAWAERAAERRFERLAVAALEARPGASMAAYEGPEGRGVAIEGPLGRALLLRPQGGVGAPRFLSEAGEWQDVRSEADVGPTPAPALASETAVAVEP